MSQVPEPGARAKSYVDSKRVNVASKRVTVASKRVTVASKRVTVASNDRPLLGDITWRHRPKILQIHRLEGT
jgi:hypothetical protein